MSDIIKADFDALRKLAVEKQGMINQLKDIVNVLSESQHTIDWDVMAKENLDRDMRALCNELESDKALLTKLIQFLGTTADEFESCENGLMQALIGAEGGNGLGKIAEFLSMMQLSALIGRKNCAFAGDPVNVVTGSFYLPATDLIITDLTEDFKIERIYVSTDKSTGLLGTGWMLNYETSILIEPNTIALLCMDGHVEMFENKETGWENTKNGSRQYVLTHDEETNQWKIQDSINKRTYLYNETGNLETIIDQNHNTLEITYDEKEIRTLKTFSGNYLEFTYENGKITHIKDELNRTLSYHYEGDFLTEVIHVDGGITQYSYTEEGYIQSVIDANGNPYVVNTYDEKGRVIYQELSNNDTCEITYDENALETTFYYGLSQRTEKYKYNSEYLITQKIFEDGSTEDYSYDLYQNRTSTKDRNESIHKKHYNIQGNIIQEHLPNGLKIDYTYDTEQNLIKIEDSHGGEQNYTYDNHGNILTVQRKIDDQTRQTLGFTYDAHGRILQTIDALNNSRTYTYPDSEILQSGPSQVTDSEGSTYQYTYDILGRNTAIITALGQVTFEYNALNHIEKITDAKGGITRKHYDKLGNLTHLITPNNYTPETDNGAATEFQYDTLDTLIQIKDPLGTIYKSTVDSQGNIIKVVNPNHYNPQTDDGTGIEYQYDKDNRRIRTLYPDGGIERFYYDSQGNVIKHITPEYYNPQTDDGQGYTYIYSTMNQITQIINPEGITEKTYTYDPYGNITQETDAQGITKHARYNLAGNLIEQRDPVEKKDGVLTYQVTLFRYDLNGNKIREHHGKQPVSLQEYPTEYNELTFAYDRNNRLIELKDKLGAQVQYQYNALNQKTLECFRINATTNKTIHYTYDKAGLLVEKREELTNQETPATTTYQYDTNGNLTNITTPKGHEIIRAYNALDQMVEEHQKDKTNGIHRKTSYEYDRAGNIIKIINTTNPENITQKEYTYDAQNRLTHETDELGNIKRICYDKNNRIIKTILPEAYDPETDNGQGTTLHYNTKDQIVEIINPLGQQVASRTYDLRGNLKTLQDGSGTRIEYTYTLQGNIKTISTPGSREQGKTLQTYQYDSRGNITGIEDGLGNQTTYKLDDWGRIIEIITPEGGTETYTYDYAGNITSTTDSNGNTITYEFNEQGKVKKIIDPEGHAEHLTYDAEGYLQEHIDRNGNQVQYGFNLDGNLTYRKGRNSTNTQELYQAFRYNPDGTLQQAITGGMAYTYTYTKGGLLKSKQASGKTLIAYEYNKNNKIAAIEDITGNTTRYTYDPANRVQKVLDKTLSTLAEYSYTADDQLQKITYGNGMETTYTYDQDKNVLGLATQNAQGESLATWSYTYDLNGNRLSKASQNHQTTYNYDSLNRLVQATYNGRKETYQYDKVGNRLAKETENTLERYTYNAKNQLTEHQKENGTTHYYYDNQGNTLKETTPEGTNTFEYNIFNQQIKAVTQEGNTLVSRYDAEGLRTEIEENEKLVKFLFHKDNVLVELDQNDTPISRFSRGFEVVSADIREKETSTLNRYYYHQDEQGSTSFITDKTGAVQNSYYYDAFGVVLESQEKVHNRITYTGQQYDSITQQYYLRARYYNPVIGRFTQEDPYRGDGLNLYAYCKNNPVIYYDPSGFVACESKGNSFFDGLKFNIKDGINRSIDFVGGSGEGLAQQFNKYKSLLETGFKVIKDKGSYIIKGAIDRNNFFNNVLGTKYKIENLNNFPALKEAIKAEFMLKYAKYGPAISKIGTKLAWTAVFFTAGSNLYKNISEGESASQTLADLATDVAMGAGGFFASAYGARFGAWVGGGAGGIIATLAGPEATPAGALVGSLAGGIGGAVAGSMGWDWVVSKTQIDKKLNRNLKQVLSPIDDVIKNGSEKLDGFLKSDPLKDISTKLKFRPIIAPII